MRWTLLYLPLWAYRYPELTLLDLRRDRRTAILETLRLIEPNKRHRSGIEMIWWANAVVVVLVLTYFRAWSLFAFVLLTAIGMGIVYLVRPLFRLLDAQSRTDIFRRQLRRQITNLGRPVCVECGYDLRGSQGARCVECGQPLPLMRYLVRVASPYGDQPDNWHVTALAEGHAKELLLAYFEQHGLSEREVLAVRQVVVKKPIERCGEIEREERTDG